MKTSSSSTVDQEQQREQRHCFCIPVCHFFEQLIKACLNCLGLDDYSAAQYDHIVLMADPPPENAREMKCSEDEGTRSGTGRELRTGVKEPHVHSGHGAQIN
ncbi:hypothetical protein ABKV19_008006 [Rosa sericea]